MTLDNRKKCIKEFSKTIKSEYTIKMQHITKQIP